MLTLFQSLGKLIKHLYHEGLTVVPFVDREFSTKNTQLWPNLGQVAVYRNNTEECVPFAVVFQIRLCSDSILFGFPDPDSFRLVTNPDPFLHGPNTSFPSNLLECTSTCVGANPLAGKFPHVIFIG
jgi:hypothetical protein